MDIKIIRKLYLSHLNRNTNYVLHDLRSEIVTKYFFSVRSVEFLDKISVAVGCCSLSPSVHFAVV